MMKCPVCRNGNSNSFTKEETRYWICDYCGTCYCGEIDQSNKVGGQSEEIRNAEHNTTRIERFKALQVGDRLLDFGCGSGFLVETAIAHALKCVGYDKFNPEKDVLPEGEFDIISMVEVIEHLTHPFDELDAVKSKLKNGGILYIETSFMDMFMNKKPEDIPYIAPSLGHHTIFSYYGLSVLMTLKGFKAMGAINQNTLLFMKKG